MGQVLTKQHSRLFVIILVFVIIFYLQGYFKYGDFQIIQTNLTQFQQNILYEKKPIYLYNQIVNPADLLHTLFKYQYIYHELSISDESIVKRNLSKFVIVYNDSEQEDVYISLLHPLNFNDKFKCDHSQTFVRKNFLIVKSDDLSANDTNIEVKLKPKNAFIIPLHWYYHTKSSGLIEIHLFDTISSISSFIQ